MSAADTLPAQQRVGILVFDGFEPIDVFGFAEAFSIARYLGQDYAAPGPYPFCITLIARSIASVRSINGPAVLPDVDMQQALADPPDVLMIPGGGGIWPLLDDKTDPAGVAALKEWVVAMDKPVC